MPCQGIEDFIKLNSKAYDAPAIAFFHGIWPIKRPLDQVKIFFTLFVVYIVEHMIRVCLFYKLTCPNFCGLFSFLDSKA